ncbi:uncharacterized protein LOC111829462 [Capsella rubella]|uniref:uncharacterized protein LOC111829462 n=1 Tax=Capsella rubella TaxID=81985 RepID=UPI000CD50F99|nr:uncharacterized protein LOC111829462 [Capsella rubella]
MEPIKSYSPSYGWRSIISARSLVNRGLIKRVGSEDTISVWSDPWIPSQFPRPASSNGSPLDPFLRIQDLVDRQNNSWRTEVLQEHFASEDIQVIRAIPVGNRPSGDVIGWHFTKNGKYTVKSGYQVARMAGPRSPVLTVYGPDILPLVAKVWRESIVMPAALVVAIYGKLLTTSSLNVLRLAKGPIGFLPMVVQVARDEARIWHDAQIEEVDIPLVLPVDRQQRVSGVTGRNVQLPPLLAGSRCFIDGSWKDSDIYAGLGWFCQSAMEAPPIMGASNRYRSLSPLHAEVEALVWAMRCMIGHNFRDVSFLTDCSDLVKMVSSPQDWPAFSVYLDDIFTDRE